MSMQFNLTKDSSQAPISFNLSKVQKYVAELYWETKHDLDVHAFLLNNESKIESYQDVISTYNSNLFLLDDMSKNHVSGGKKPFTNESKSVIHMGDKRTGISANEREPDEVIEIVLSNIPNEKERVPFFIGSHPPHIVKFKDVSGCKLVIKDDSNNVLLEANLTNDFDEFDMVQMGSLVKIGGDWQFDPKSIGINGDFNTLIGLFG